MAVPEWKTKFVYKDGKYLLFESNITEELVRKYSSKPYGLKSVIEMDDYWLDVLLDYLELPSGLNGLSLKGKYEMIQEDYPYYLESTESLSGGAMSFYERFAYCFSDVIEVSSTSNSVTLKTVGFMRDATKGKLERSLDKESFEDIKNDFKVGDSFTDTGLKASTKYYYRFDGVVVEVTTLAQGSSNGGENTSKDPKPSESQDNIKNPNTGDGTLAMVFFLVCGLIFVGYKYIKNKKEAIR